MATISADKETLYSGSWDEYGVVSIKRVTRITDDTGEVLERIHRVAFTPVDDISDLPQRAQDIIAACRYPEAVARWEEQQANVEPPPTP